MGLGERRARGDEGITLVELLVTMILLGVVSAGVVAAVANTGKLFRATDDESTGQTDVRATIERLGRDVRNARAVDPGATPSQLALWIDSDSDYIRDVEEIVTWRLVANSTGKFDVTRLVNGQTSRTARLVISDIAFCYQTTTGSPCLAAPLSTAIASQVRVVSSNITYDANLRAGSTGSRSTTFSERLRNVP